jgi:hypothetical protein
VPHFWQMPLVAGRLFFRVTDLAFLISTLDLHLKQYACAILFPSSYRDALNYSLRAASLSRARTGLERIRCGPHGSERQPAE